MNNMHIGTTMQYIQIKLQHTVYERKCLAKWIFYRIKPVQTVLFIQPCTKMNRSNCICVIIDIFWLDISEVPVVRQPRASVDGLVVSSGCLWETSTSTLKGTLSERFTEINHIWAFLVTDAVTCVSTFQIWNVCKWVERLWTSTFQHWPYLRNFLSCEKWTDQPITIEVCCNNVHLYFSALRDTHVFCASSSKNRRSRKRRRLHSRPPPTEPVYSLRRWESTF